MPDWETVQKDRLKHQRTPQMSIYANGNGHVNAAGDHLLGKPDRVTLRIDDAEGLLGLDPTDGDDPNGYAVSRDTRNDRSNGGDVNVKTALRHLGVDVDALEATRHVELADEDGIAVADLSGFPGLDSEDGKGGDPDVDELGPARTGGQPHSEARARICSALADRGELSGPELESVAEVGSDFYRFLSDLEDSGAISKRKDPDDGRQALYSLDEESGPSLKIVRDGAASVETVQQLADLLDIDIHKARARAVTAGVYGDLDDEVRRMGAPEAS